MRERTTQNVRNVLGKVALGAAAAAMALSYAPISFAQADSRPSGSDQARQTQMKDLKAKIDNLEGQLHKLQSHGAVVASGAKTDSNTSPPGCCPSGGQMAQAGSNGSEHPMGGEMGGMGGTDASPAASPGGETAASPGAMPMAHGMPMGNNMGRKMGEGMGDGGKRGGASGDAQPEASPSAGMGGMKDDM